MPAARLSAGLSQDPPTDRHDVTRVLGKRDELVRSDRWARTVPAEQCLCRDNPAGREFDNRLIDKSEFVGGECPSKLSLELKARKLASVHGRLEEREAAARCRFSLIHRRIGVAEQFGRADSR